jgi:hypothetical protein
MNEKAEEEGEQPFKMGEGGVGEGGGIEKRSRRKCYV